MTSPAAPGAYAIVNDDPPRLLLAENAGVMDRLLAFEVVAAENPEHFSESQLNRLCDALNAAKWTEATVLWMEFTGITIDVYEQYVPIWGEADLNAEMAQFEVKMSRLMR